jgi:hypothetical protein
MGTTLPPLWNANARFAVPASRPSNPWQNWCRFWFSAVDPSSLGLIRIMTGLMVLYVHLTYTGTLVSFFGKDGWINLEMVNDYRHSQPIYAPMLDGWFPDLEDERFKQEPTQKQIEFTTRWGGNPDVRFETIGQGQQIASIWFHVTDPHWMMALHVGFLVIMFLFTIGFCTRLTAVLTWLAAVSYIQRSWATVFGMDTIMNLLLLYLMIGPSGAAYSVDSWLKRRRMAKAGQGLPPGFHPVPAPSVLANFAIHLMQINFCIIYLASATSKLQGSTWWNGTAIWAVTANPEFNPMNVDFYFQFVTFLVKHRVLWEIAMTSGVLFTLFVELGFPFLVWNRRLRPFMIMGSVMLHIGIGLIMGLTTFSLLMLTMVISFIPGATTRWAVNGSLDWLKGVTSSKNVEKPALSASGAA